MMRRRTARRTGQGGAGDRSAIVFFLLALSSCTVVQAQFGSHVIDASQDFETTQVVPRDILMEFFQQTGGFGWKSMEQWLSDDVCSYEGVTCYDSDYEDVRRVGHVRSIEMVDNGLVGVTPNSMWKLPYLEFVNVNLNPQLVVDFSGIGDAQYLERLHLDDTATKNFAGLEHAASSVTELSISNLAIQGPMPSQVYQLSKLTTLTAQDSQLTGELQGSLLGLLQFLVVLVLKDNKLQGKIPTQVGLLRNLQSLQLANNQWTGVLPADYIDQLTELRTIDLSRESNAPGQGLTGVLPSFRNSMYVTFIDFQNQDLSGNFPDYFLEQAPTDKPIKVNLQGNQLSGIVPLRSLQDKKNLDLFLADNQITSVDDTSVCSQLSQWLNRDVVMGSGCNGFLCPVGTYSPTQGRGTSRASCQTCSGALYMGASTCYTTSTGAVNELPILQEFFQATNGAQWKETEGWYSTNMQYSTTANYCTWFGVTCDSQGQVTRILLPNNDLSGSVPSSLFMLPFLEQLDLSLNSLSFSFQGISRAFRLDTLDLTQTDLSSWDNIDQLKQTSIRVLRLASNDLTGSLSDSIYDMTKLQELDVSNNDLSGALQSGKLPQLVHLETLNLNGNQFSGSLPGVTLCASNTMSVLTNFQASENKFTGGLPSAWDNCRQLQQINLRNNNLSGSLPSWPNLGLLEQVDVSGNSMENNLPIEFLGSSSAYQNRRLVLDLADNQFTGAGLPPSWAFRFFNLVVDLTGNKFTSLGVSDCTQGLMRGWMDGLVEKFGCAAILCGAGTYNEVGRQTSQEATCRPCSQAKDPTILGATTCASQDITIVGKEIGILTEFFEATNGQSWKRSDGWTITQDYCSWFGITCDSVSKKVQAISMENNGLTGTPPASLFQLIDLSELDLRQNQIDFSFNGIGSARSLLSLDLSSTQLDSVDGLEQATSLLELRLDDNDLKGNFPTQIMALSTLRHLSINYNQLEGDLPSKISSQFPHLRGLFLLQNNFSGRLPGELGKLSQLTYLGLSGNNWEGSIPDDFNKLSSLETMSLERRPESVGRGLYGPLPALDQLGNLKQVYLGHNSFSGVIPDNFLGGIEDKAAPIIVDLSNNRLTGGLPPALTRFESMELFASGNMFTEPIPTGICRQPGWMRAQIASLGCDAIMCRPDTFQPETGRAHGTETCKPCPEGETAEYYGSYSCMSVALREEQGERRILAEFFESTNGEHWVNNDGWLDPDFSVCEWYGIVCDFANSSSAKNVESIQLVHNDLEGTIPNSIFLLKDLMELDLSFNDIEISFDTSKISQAKSLLYLNLDYTGLSSLEGIQNIPALELLHAEGNNFNGVFPTQVFSISTLVALYLSDNDIGDALPNNVPASLLGFACSKCYLKGQFPSSLSPLTSLEYLDLSDNFLTGSVPTSFGSLTKLKHVDLSDQRSADSDGLSGNLPSFALAPDLRELYLQNNGFGNTIPSDFLALVNASSKVRVDLSFNQLAGTIPGDLSRLVNADFYAAGNLLTGISNNLCSLPWNNRPSNGLSNCDYILCGQAEYNGLGRATSTLPCETCASATYAGSTYCVEGEREILNELYTALGGKLWTHNDGWTSDADVCTWYGITCHGGTFRAGTVKSLDLGDNNMQGTLPDRFWLLTELEECDFSENNIIVNSFAKAGDATSLKSLSLSHNTVLSIAGIGDVNSLTSFHCTNCNIQGPLLDELFDLRMLESLYLSYNEITGSLPNRIRSLVNLKELHLVHNKLNSTLPFGLVTIPSIEVIALGHNQFTGTMPNDISFLPNLRVLAIDFEKPATVEFFSVVTTGLTGNLPSFKRNQKLREIYLGYNNFVGTIPSDFLDGVDDKSEAITVDLTSNDLHGDVPATLAQFDELYLYLSDNRMESIAPEVCAKKEWMNGLMASSCDALLCPIGHFNELGRRTPTEDCRVCDHQYMATALGTVHCFAAFTEYRTDKDMLEEIYDNANGDEWVNNKNWKNPSISICQWTGITCEESKLRKINVSGNDIRISLKDLKEAAALEELNIENTLVADLGGLGDAAKLTSLKLGGNGFFGQPFPSEIYALSNLRILDVGNSGFSGTLSSALGQMSRLETLVAGGNELEGSIPDVFGTFNSLRVLDLSNNLFYGSVPSSLLNITSLRSLNLRGSASTTTGFSGPLPAFSESPLLAEIDLGLNSLTGTVPSNLLAALSNPSSTQVTVWLDSNVLHGTLPMSLNRFTRLNLYLANNEIEFIPQELCQMNQWMSGNVGDYLCDGLLCKAGSFAVEGRQTSGTTGCKQCPGDGGRFMGSSVCPSLAKAETKKILEDLYKKTGGAQWKNSDGWFTNPDVCKWFGITCKDNSFVETINLGSNNVIGTPPKELFDIVGLKNLWLYSNPITFNFDGIENAKALENLQLDSTKTESLVGAGSAPALTYLDVRFNGISGVLPPEINNLRFLEVLLISENHFFGPLPQFLGNRKLSILRASGNKFTGSLPTLDVHPRIKTVDLANNQLIGLIPDDFLARADTSSAMLLDLSGNMISGDLPATLSRFTELTFYARDNRISGIDPALCSRVDWNSGSVGIYGCDAILCPPQTYSSSGRASVAAGDCEPCHGAAFFGHSTCQGGSVSGISNSSANISWKWKQFCWIGGILLAITYYVV